MLEGECHIGTHRLAAGDVHLAQAGSWHEAVTTRTGVIVLLLFLSNRQRWAIIALVGCHRGFRVGGSADSVGAQTTLSVVQSIFLVIVTDAAFSVVFLWLDL